MLRTWTLGAPSTTADHVTQARLGAYEVHTTRTRLGDTLSSVYSEYTYHVILSSHLDVHIHAVSILHPYRSAASAIQ
jgi:hypothetical protein